MSQFDGFFEEKDNQLSGVGEEPSTSLIGDGFDDFFSEQPEPQLPQRTSLYNAVRQNPDEAAKLRDLSKRSGIPADAVATDPAAVEADLRFKGIDFTGLQQNNPTTSAFMSIPDNANVAHDDMETFVGVEDWLNRKDPQSTGERYTNALKRGSVNTGVLGEYLGFSLDKFISNIGRNLLPAPRGVSDEEWHTRREELMLGRGYAGMLKAAEASAEIPVDEKMQEFSEVVAAAEEQGTDVAIATGIEYLAKNPSVLGIVVAEQLMPMAVSLPVGGWGGSAAVKITNPLVSRIANQAAQEYLRRSIQLGAVNYVTNDAMVMGAELASALNDPKLSVEEAISKARTKSFVEGGVNAAFAFLPVPQGATTVGKLASLTGETVKQGTAGATGAAAAAYSVGEEIELSELMLEFFGEAVTAPVDLAVIAGEEVQMRNQFKQAVTALKSNSEQQRIDALETIVADSKVKNRSKDVLKQFVEQAQQDGDNVYIPAQALQEYLNQNEVDLTDPAFASVADQIAEAAALGGDVLMPVSDFVTDMVGSEHYGPLRQHMRLSSESLTPAEQQQAIAENEAFVQQLVEEATANAQEFEESKRIYEEVKEQLIQTGVVDRRAAKFMAEIIPAWATSMAQRTGQTVAEVYENAGLRVQGPFADQQAEIAAARDEGLIEQAQQTGFEGTDRGEAAQWVAAVEKGLDMSTEARMQRAREMGFNTDNVQYHGTFTDFSGFSAQDTDSFVGRGVYLTNNPEDASRYASTDVGENPDLIVKTDILQKLMGVDRAEARDLLTSDGGRVVPTIVRSDNPVRLGNDGLTINGQQVDMTDSRNQQSLREEGVSDIDLFVRQWNRIGKNDRKLMDNLVGPEGTQAEAYIELLRSNKAIPAIRGIAVTHGADSIVLADGSAPVPGNVGDSEHTIIFDPSQIRSVNAAFDPAAADSADLLAQSPVENRGVRGDGGISTRKPTAKAATENPNQKNLIVGLSAAKKDRKSFDKNAAVIETYTNFRPAATADTPDKVVNRFITHVKNNLLWLYDQVPADIRERSHLWYDGARNITDRWTERFGVPDTAVAGALAALSPQKDWFMNVSLAERVLDTYINKQNEAWSDEMTATAARIFGKPQYKELVERISGTTLSQHSNPVDIAAWIRTYDEAHNERGHRIVSPEGFFQDWAVSQSGARKKTGWGSLTEIAKAVSVIQDPSVENISNQMGEMHKVRNFYNNIIAPKAEHGDVTIDTHAVAAGLLKPLAGASLEVGHNFATGGVASSSLTGVKGTYGIYAEAYRRAAKERNILAREMQSITWEAVRGLFPAGYKSQQKNVDAIEAIWQKYRDGKLSLEKAREQINEHAGGITNPDWVGHDGELDAAKPDSSFSEELSGDQLPRLEQSQVGRLGRGAGVADTEGAGRQAAGPIGRIRSLLRRDGTVDGGQRGAYSRAAEADAGGNVTFTPSAELVDALTEAGASAPVYVRTTDAQDFLAKITKAKGTNPHSAAVEIKSLDEYASGDYKLFLTEDGAAGFAVKNDGDIVSVFKDPESDIKGFVLSSLSLAIEQGGNKLDAFDTVLPALYSQMGFVARSRLPWVEEFSPENWDKELFSNFNNGEPDVVLMSLDPDSNTLYSRGDGQSFDDWDEAAGLRDSFLDQLEQSAFHGTPHQFDRFSLEAIGTGEGAQAFGWGLYFASKRGVAEWYRDKLSKQGSTRVSLNGEEVTAQQDDALYTMIFETLNWGKPAMAEMVQDLDPNDEFAQAWEKVKDADLAQINEGSLFQVDIPESDVLLDWDKSLSEQPAEVRDALLPYLERSIYEEEQGRILGFSGEQIYRDMAEELGNDEAASAQLNSLGIPGLQYLDGTARGTDGDAHNYVIWDENTVTIEAVNDELVAAQELKQDRRTEVPTKARGYFDPNTVTIRMTEAADPSTFLHEAAHFFLEMERRAQTDLFTETKAWWGRNAEAVANEAKTYIDQAVTPEQVTQYIETGTTGDINVDRALWRATHEQFARGFEAYLMEGKAPSEGLRAAFRAFARWLNSVYRRVRGDLKVSLDNEIRQVFDRLLATEEEIARVQSENNYRPLFTDAAMAGMTEEEFAAYQERQQKATSKANETLYEKLLGELTRQTTKWWNTELRERQKQAEEDLGNTRVYNAINQLRDGEMKLDRAAVKEQLGVDKIPPSLRNMTVTGAEGVVPDEAAAFLGYTSADEMLKDITKARPIKEVAKERAEAEMKNEHGDILNNGTLEKEAQEAARNEERGKLILEEMKALSRQQRRPAVDRQVIKGLARESIGKMKLKDIRPDKYHRAEIKAAQAAQSAMEAGDTAAALQAKTQQLMNFYLWREAMAARSEADKIVKYTKKFGKKKTREQIAKAGNGYLEQIDGLLDRFEFRKSMRQVDRDNIETWAAMRSEAGDNIQLTKEALNEAMRTHYKNVPFSQLQGVHDSIRNLEHVARFANKIKLEGERIDFARVKQQWLDHLDALPVKFKPQRTDTVAAGPGKVLRWATAQMTKMPFLTSWLDGGERVGLSHQLIMQPINDAYDAEQKLWKQVGTAVMEAIGGRDKATIKRHNKKIHIPEIMNENNDGNLMGHQVLAVALNTGNQSNLRKMLLGEGWAQTDEEVSLDNPRLQAVLQYMTKEDWELVQLIWDQIDSLYPLMAEVHKLTSGLDLAKVEATPVETPFGTFNGGYYPVKYDPNRNKRAQDNEDKMNEQTQSMFAEGGFIRPTADTGAKFERTEFFGPIKLNLDVVPNHIQEVIHYITHFDAVRQIHKLTNDPEIAAAISERIGPEEYKQFKPWLNDIAKEGRDAPEKSYITKVFQRLRFGVTLGAMGFKASTGIMQVSGLSNAAAELGTGNLVRGLRDVFESGGTRSFRSLGVNQDAWDWAVANSKVMEHRAKSFDREIKNAMNQIAGKRGVIPAVQEASMKHIALIQTYLVDLPTWYGAYHKGMQDFDGNEKRAFQYADWAVENIHGSGATKDMARLMRLPDELARQMSMFMTFFSALWNQERDAFRGAVNGTYSPTQVAAKMMFLFAIPVAFEMLLRGELGDEDDDEELQKYLTNLALYPVQSVPFLRDIANVAATDFPYRGSPAIDLMAKGLQGTEKVFGGMLTDDEITKAQVKNASKLAAAAAGIPGTGQAWATGEHLYEVLEEGEDLTLREFLFGPNREN